MIERTVLYHLAAAREGPTTDADSDVCMSDAQAQAHGCSRAEGMVLHVKHLESAPGGDEQLRSR
jgi:hypothetical protein